MASSETTDVTLKKLKNQFATYCKEKVSTMEKNKNYVASSTLKSDFITYAKDLINKNQNSLSEVELLQLKTYCDKYIANKISSYETTLKRQKEEALSALDTDPTVKDGITYINNRKLTVFSNYHGTNSTYSMADMVASISIKTDYGTITTSLGELQTLSYSIYQNKTPVRVLGNMNAKDWVFGPRTIAGSLVFAVFNKHWLMNLYDNLKEKAGMKNWHFISDEIPAFDITLTFANEYGFDSRMAIYGVRLMNEGQTMSTNDIYIENTYQFVANDIELMDSLRAYQTGESRHKRGQLIDNTKQENADSKNSTATPIDENKNKVADDSISTTKYTSDKLAISEEKLAKMDKSTALKTLDTYYKAWYEEVSNYVKQHKKNPTDEEDAEYIKSVKNQVKADYKTQKEKIKEYYNNKNSDSSKKEND